MKELLEAEELTGVLRVGKVTDRADDSYTTDPFTITK